MQIGLDKGFKHVDTLVERNVIILEDLSQTVKEFIRRKVCSLHRCDREAKPDGVDHITWNSIIPLVLAV